MKRIILIPLCFLFTHLFSQVDVHNDLQIRNSLLFSGKKLIGVSNDSTNSHKDSFKLITEFAAKRYADQISGSGGTSGWGLNGNSITTSNYLGSNNNRSLRLKTNGIERLVIDSNGNVGIGTLHPIYPFEVGITSKFGGVSIDNLQLPIINNGFHNGAITDSLITTDASGNKSYSIRSTSFF